MLNQFTQWTPTTPLLHLFLDHSNLHSFIYSKPSPPFNIHVVTISHLPSVYREVFRRIPTVYKYFNEPQKHNATLFPAAYASTVIAESRDR